MTRRAALLTLAALLCAPATRAFKAPDVGAAPDTLAVRHLPREERPSAGGWTADAPMSTGRLQPALARLRDGRVMVAGGYLGDVTSLASVETYDPVRRSWTSLAPMIDDRYDMVLAVLKDGRVLAAGGRHNRQNRDEADLDVSEIYDPGTDSWSPTTPMPEPRCDSTWFVMPDGRVLVAGGVSHGRNLSSVVVYDPRTRRWSRGPEMGTARASASAVVLDDGRFLVAGGNGQSGEQSTAEIYDPAADRWTPTGRMTRSIYAFTLTKLRDGRVLAAGGGRTGGGGTARAAGLYDPRADRWTETTPGVSAHSSGQATLVGDRVLVTGGSDVSGRMDLTEYYDPAADRWSQGPNLGTPRVFHAQMVLPGGDVLLLGGRTSGGFAPALATTERLTPGKAAAEPAVARPAVAAKSPERPHDFALVIGITGYKSLPLADYGEDDARDAAAALRGLGVPEENTVVLTGSKASLSEVSKYVEEWLPRRVSPDSRVYFYYSGHGAPEIKDGSAYLMPWDGDVTFVKSTGFPLKRLYDSLGALKVARVVAMIDACFSGAGGRSVLVAGVRPLVTVRLPAAASPRISILTAAEGDEVAGSLPERGHGLFSYYLIRGLSGAAAPGAEHLTLAELYRYVRKEVIIGARRQNREQNPTMVSPSPDLRLY